MHNLQTYIILKLYLCGMTYYYYYYKYCIHSLSNIFTYIIKGTLYYKSHYIRHNIN